MRALENIFQCLICFTLFKMLQLLQSIYIIILEAETAYRRKNVTTIKLCGHVRL